MTIFASLLLPSQPRMLGIGLQNERSLAGKGSEILESGHFCKTFLFFFMLSIASSPLVR